MKHKILISMDPEGNAPMFLGDVKNILNTTHDKFLTGISISSYLEKKSILSGSKKSKTVKSQNLDTVTESEESLRQEAKRLGINFNNLKREIDDIALITLSSVADLLIIDRKMVQRFCGKEVLSQLIESVVCPVLILPSDTHIESLVIVHDGTLSSVHAVKHFIRLFKRDLRKLPVYVLISEPENKKDIQGEKVFIEYIKMFFEDLGIQLMDDELVNCVIRNIDSISESPMVVLGEIGGNNILNFAYENNIITNNVPTFIFKHLRSEVVQ